VWIIRNDEDALIEMFKTDKEETREALALDMWSSYKPRSSWIAWVSFQCLLDCFHTPNTEGEDMEVCFIQLLVCRSRIS